MAWFLNHYRCNECGYRWDDEWSCCCDDECPPCQTGEVSPYDSDELTAIIAESDAGFIVLRSPDNAGHKANYREVGRFSTAEEAAAFLSSSYN